VPGEVPENVEAGFQADAYSGIRAIHLSSGATYLYSDRYLGQAHGMPVAQ